MRNLLSFVVISTLAGAACLNTPNSENIKTAGLRASFSTTSRAGGDVEARAEFHIGSNFVDLTAGDAVFCDDVKLGRHDALGIVTYSARVPARAPGATYAFDFRRPGPPEESHPSPVVQPDPITAAVPAGPVSVESPIVIGWNVASAGTVSINVSGSCVHNRTFTADPARGEHVIAARSLSLERDKPTPCNARVLVTRSIRGAGANTFESASTLGQAVHESTIVLVP